MNHSYVSVEQCDAGVISILPDPDAIQPDSIDPWKILSLDNVGPADAAIPM